MKGILYLSGTLKNPVVDDNTIKTLVLVPLAAGFLWDFRRNKGKFLRARMAHYTILLLLVFACSLSVPELLDLFSDSGRKRYWVQAGPISPALHFTIHTGWLATSALVIVISTLMSIRSEPARKFFLFLALAYMLTVSLKLSCDTLRGSSHPSDFLSVMGIFWLALQLGYFLVYTYRSKMMIRFFNPAPDPQTPPSLQNEDPWGMLQEIKPIPQQNPDEL